MGCEIGNADIIGKFEFTAEYSALSSYSELTLLSKRNIKELLLAGVDVFKECYLKYSRTKSEYTLDSTNNVMIHVLVAANGDLIYIPSYAVSGVPDITKVPYANMQLKIGIGLQQVDCAKLDAFKLEIIKLCKSYIGVTPSIRYDMISSVTWLSQVDSTLTEATYNTSRATNRVPSTVELQNIVDKQAQEIIDLECIIKAKAII